MPVAPAVPPTPAKPAKPLNPLLKRVLKGLLDDYEPALRDAGSRVINDVRLAIPGLAQKAKVAIDKVVDDVVMKVDTAVATNGSKLVDDVLKHVRDGLK